MERPNNLNPEIGRITKESKQRIHDLPLGHILPHDADNLVGAFSNITFASPTSRNLARLRKVDPELFNRTIDTMQEAHGIYKDGETRLREIHDKLPVEVKGAYISFLNGKADWEDFLHTCKKNNVSGVDELMYQLDTHTRRRSKLEGLVNVLKQAREVEMPELKLKKAIENVFYPE